MGASDFSRAGAAGYFQHHAGILQSLRQKLTSNLQQPFEGIKLIATAFKLEAGNPPERHQDLHEKQEAIRVQQVNTAGQGWE